MIKNYLSVLLILLTSLSLLAQTKLIAHKSHSGSNVAFLFDVNHGLGFGLPSSYSKYRQIKFKEDRKLEEVIYVSDSVAVRVITIEYKKSKEKSINIDTLYNDPLFSKQHSKDSIKSVIENRNIKYGMSTRHVKLTGYDNANKKASKKVKKKNQSEFLPLIIKDNHPPFDFHLLVLIGGVALFSVLAGLLSWKIYQVKLLIYKV